MGEEVFVEDSGGDFGTGAVEDGFGYYGCVEDGGGGGGEGGQVGEVL